MGGGGAAGEEPGWFNGDKRDGDGDDAKKSELMRTTSCTHHTESEEELDCKLSFKRVSYMGNAGCPAPFLWLENLRPEASKVSCSMASPLQENGCDSGCIRPLTRTGIRTAVVCTMLQPRAAVTKPRGFIGPKAAERRM